MPEMRQVYSSHVAEIGYDPDASALHVTYRTGKTAVYQGVPPEVAEAVGAIGSTPPSIGEALRQHVRGKYTHTYG